MQFKEYCYIKKISMDLFILSYLFIGTSHFCFTQCIFNLYPSSEGIDKILLVQYQVQIHGSWPFTLSDPPLRQGLNKEGKILYWNIHAHFLFINLIIEYHKFADKADSIIRLLWTTLITCTYLFTWKIVHYCQDNISNLGQ